MRLKNIVAFGLCLWCVFFLSAQDTRINAITKSPKRDVLINLSGSIISYIDYDYVTDFDPIGVALASRKNNKEFYIINKIGNVVFSEFPFTPYNYEWGELPLSFSDGVLCVEHKNLIGVVNQKGELIIPFKYKELTRFESGNAIGIRDGSYYVVNKKGQEQLIQSEKIKDFKRFIEGLAPVKINDLYGFVDTTGKIAIEPRFWTVGYFHGGIAWAKDSKTGLVGYINKSGEWLIEPIFNGGKDFDPVSGIARIRGEQGWGYIDMKNNFSKFGVKDVYYDFSEGLAIYREGDYVGFMNNKGELVIPAIYKAAKYFKNGYARVESDKGWGIIDKKGNWVIQPTYKSIGDVIFVE